MTGDSYLEVKSLYGFHQYFLHVLPNTCYILFIIVVYIFNSRYPKMYESEF